MEKEFEKMIELIKQFPVKDYVIIKPKYNWDIFNPPTKQQ